VSHGKGTTDVGDVSWEVPGMAAHSWQAGAGGGGDTTIGVKGMIVADKTLARTAVALFQDPATLAAARQKLEHQRGEDFVYRPLLGDRKPPLDYRD
jgi:aminobenzoyl-glutamate utilization protein B